MTSPGSHTHLADCQVVALPGAADAGWRTPVRPHWWYGDHEHAQLTRRHDDRLRQAGRGTGPDPGRRRADRPFIRLRVGADQAARAALHGLRLRPARPRRERGHTAL